MPKIITEDMIEQAAIKALQERHNYTVLNCMTEEPDTLPDGTGRKDKKQVVLPDVMLESLCRINPDIPEQTVRTVVNELCHTPVSGDLMLTNYQNYQKIRNGITVEYNKNGKKTSKILHLLSYNDVLSNTFTVASQMWIKGETHWRRPDLIIFINGFPLVFIELKNSNIPVKNAYDINLKNYLKDIPYLFNYNQICVLSNGMETRLGSFAAGYEFFFEWLKVENEKENPDRKAIRENCTSLEYFIAGLCEPKNLLDYIENFILYDRRRTKIIAKNHQFFGVNNAYNAFLRREELKGKLGVFWHTQGSGKSYSMVMLARKIKHKCTGNFTFLIVTDREDLDTQIYKNFLRTEFITDKDKVQPANSKQLREELKTNKSILFTLIHKFRYDKGKKYPVLSERDDIIVIVDEAHRTQYKDLAENMRTGLPNAQFLAFTGTPLLGAKRLTNAWFGDYVSEYNFAESIKDNATVPLYYVKRVPEVELQNDFLDSDFAEILEEENLTDAEQRRLENHYAKELEVIKRDDRLDAIAQHIDEYNAGGSQNDDFYEKLLKLMEELRTEEERHIKEELSEAELELFDLLRKEQLTADEEKHVKLAAKELYNTLTEKRNELFIVGWQNDPQPKERVKGEIVYILNKFLPESYDREVFLRKSTLVFDHIVDQAMTGYNWVA